MPNLELLKKTRDHVKAFPTTHDQGTWYCDTSACIAGHAALLDGATLGRIGAGMLTLRFEGRIVVASEFAKERLGLTWAEADYLFYCMDNEVAVQRLDQLIELAEKGEKFNPEVHWIQDEEPEEDYDEDE